MKMPGCCGKGSERKTDDFELVRIEKAKSVCPVCEEYAQRQKAKPVAVICCEGACLRGEVARQAANLLCHELAPEQTVRVCLGAAFSKDTGQRSLVRNAGRLLALEGCHVNCASRMMQGAIPRLTPEIVKVDRLYDFDRTLFGIDEMPAAEIAAHARTVARKVADLLPEPQTLPLVARFFSL